MGHYFSHRDAWIIEMMIYHEQRLGIVCRLTLSKIVIKRALERAVSV